MRITKTFIIAVISLLLIFALGFSVHYLTKNNNKNDLNNKLEQNNDNSVNSDNSFEKTEQSEFIEKEVIERIYQNESKTSSYNEVVFDEVERVYFES